MNTVSSHLRLGIGVPKYPTAHAATSGFLLCKIQRVFMSSWVDQLQNWPVRWFRYAKFTQPGAQYSRCRLNLLIEILAMPKNYENDSQHECPILTAVGQFWVKITQPIKERCLIQPGEFLLIDPRSNPLPGQLIVAGDVIEPYADQSIVDGVVVLVWGDDFAGVI